MHGLEGLTAVYYLPAPRPAIIETGPASSLDHVLVGLKEAEVSDPDWIVLTHIHLDHAGAVGHLAQRYPRARIVVRAEGAPHLVDPTRLWESAGRLYPDMDRLWGRMVPVPEERIDVISSDSTVADLGDGRSLEAVYAPGHAKHHMALIDRSRGDLFVGDAIGVYLQEAKVIRPATPPPEFDLEANLETIGKLRALGATRVFPTHFGAVPDNEAAFDEGAQRLEQWVAVAAEVVEAGGDVPEVVEAFKDRTRADYEHLGEALLDKLEQTTSFELNALGIVRYLRKRQKDTS